MTHPEEPVLRPTDLPAANDAGACPYAELHCLSDFSFLRGASSAAQLFARAKACGYAALAITDECSLAGIVRAFEAAQKTGVPLIIGSEFTLEDGPKLVLLVQDLDGYTTLCALITQARLRGEKGRYRIRRDDFARPLPGLLALWIPQEQQAGIPDAEPGHWVRQTFSQAWLAIELHRDGDDAARLARLLQLAAQTGLPPVAAGDVHMDLRRRRALQDTLTALRHNLPVAEAGAHLFRNGERHLRRREALAALYPAALLAETVRIASLCTFRLDSLRYRYPHELTPPGHSATSWLRTLTLRGMRWRWPQGASIAVRRQIARELRLIAELRYEAYFLTVHDIVRFARGQGILCQGRGSAANSAVCFALGITEVDPHKTRLLMERFISRERGEPPDIDVDFEHERREQVFQYIYAKYGRQRAALTANVICWRGRSAARDVARVLGFAMDQVNALSACAERWGSAAPSPERLREAGFDPDSPVMRRFSYLTAELIDHPRHLSQHVGGFVISDAPLSQLVPIENAAMPERTIIQWNKDDLDVLGMLKVDCLALGMLSAIRKAFDLLQALRGTRWSMADIPQEDPATYAMIQQADTIGTFQIESRAQMSMLPRLKPATFYDLVVQVAIVRPGPIQGKMVPPYLRRRQGLEPTPYHPPDLQPVFARTLGVPLFQEQVMQLAIVAAGYSPGEADQLRRSMAAWRRHGDMEVHRQRIIGGMQARGYDAAFAEQIFEQLKGFASYGFPESHAYSFALLSYVSSWLKCHEPAAFTCALLNAQPMGFYSPSALIQDAQRHGVAVRGVDVQHSHWDCTLEPHALPADGPAHRPSSALSGPAPHGPVHPASLRQARDQPAIRLGLRQIKGLSETAAARIVQSRLRDGPFASVAQLCHRAALDAREATCLAEAGALATLAGHRNRARWEVAGVEPVRPLLPDGPDEAAAGLPAPDAAAEAMADYRTLGLTLGAHPIALLRAQLQARRCLASAQLLQCRHGSLVRAAGLVTVRQRPGTASGVTFLTLEDEHGCINVVVWRALAERQRRQLHNARLLAIDGRWERVDGVAHLIARRLHDWTAMLGSLRTHSRDFH